MNPTYTPSSGLTPQGSQVDQLTQLLSSAQTLPPASPTNQQVAGAQANAANYAANEPAYIQQTQQALTQQSGIPNLENQQSNLAQIFPLYLADQNLSQKYSSSQLSSPNSPVYNNPSLTPQTGIYTGDTSGVPNPYLASPQDLINAVTQPSGQGFQGFSSPGLNTGAIGQVPQAATNIMNLLQSAIGSEQGLVSGKTAQAQSDYERQASLLNTIATLFGQEQAQQASLNAPGGAGYSQAQIANAYADAQKRMTLSDMLKKYEQLGMTPNDIYAIYNTVNNDPTGKKNYGPAKESADQLSQLGITGAPITQANKQVYKSKVDAKGNVLGYYSPSGKYIPITKSGGIFGVGGEQVLHVRDKQTGEIGTIPLSEFDTSIYEPN